MVQFAHTNTDPHIGQTMRDKTNYSETFTGKVTVCEADVDGSKAKESTRAYYRAARTFEREADYTDTRMREAENRGIGDIQSERMMLHGEL